MEQTEWYFLSSLEEAKMSQQGRLESINQKSIEEQVIAQHCSFKSYSSLWNHKKME